MAADQQTRGQMSPRSVVGGSRTEYYDATENHTTENDNSEARRVWLVIFVGLLFIIDSFGLIALGKYLMDESRFPYPAAKISIDMFGGFVYVIMTRFVYPSVFTSWDILAKDPTVTILKLMPIGVCTAAEFVLGTMAYMFVSVEEKFTRNFRVNGEVREKIMVYNLISHEF